MSPHIHSCFYVCYEHLRWTLLLFNYITHYGVSKLYDRSPTLTHALYKKLLGLFHQHLHILLPAPYQPLVTPLLTFHDSDF